MRVILVPVADRPECAKALEVAFDLGKQLGASIHGCHIRPHRYSDVSLSLAFPEDEWEAKFGEQAPAAAKSLYHAVAERYGYAVGRQSEKPSAEWSEQVGAPDILLGIVGPLSDLIVVSQPENAGGVADVFLTASVLGTSRPVLMLPQAFDGHVATNVCIGWNQSAEIAQAVALAMPILQQAKTVRAISCGAEDRPGPKSTHLAHYLSHYGIELESVSTPGRHINQELLERCADAKADLLLTGAYSRARWRERAFGGTTEYLLRNAELPVMMLHS